MQSLGRLKLAVQSCLILVLLTAFSTSTGLANPTATPALLTMECAHCWSSPSGGEYDGDWGSECFDYESPTCRQCPQAMPDCAGGYFYNYSSDPCNVACNSESRELAGKLDAAVLRDDPVAVSALLMANAAKVSYNAERNAVQLAGCGGSIVASLPVGERVLRALDQASER